MRASKMGGDVARRYVCKMPRAGETSVRIKASCHIRTATNATILFFFFLSFPFVPFCFSWTHGSAGQKSPGVEVGSEVVRETTQYHGPIPATISMKSSSNVVSSNEWTTRR